MGKGRKLAVRPELDQVIVHLQIEVRRMYQFDITTTFRLVNRRNDRCTASHGTSCVALSRPGEAHAVPLTCLMYSGTVGTNRETAVATDFTVYMVSVSKYTKYTRCGKKGLFLDKSGKKKLPLHVQQPLCALLLLADDIFGALLRSTAF